MAYMGTCLYCFMGKKNVNWNKRSKEVSYVHKEAELPENGVQGCPACNRLRALCRL